MNGEGALPLVYLEHVDTTTRGEYAGAEDEHVKPTKRPCALLECGCDLFFVRHVANRADVGRREPQVSHTGVDVESANAGSACEEGIDAGGADAGCSACDDYRFAREIVFSLVACQLRLLERPILDGEDVGRG